MYLTYRKLPKLSRRTSGKCRCHYCTLIRFPRHLWLTPTVRTVLDIRDIPEPYLAHIRRWMQANTSTCPKAPYGGRYTALDQFDLVERHLEYFRQQRIEALPHICKEEHSTSNDPKTSNV